MKKRSRGREIALQALYQLDLCGEDQLDSIGEFLRQEESDREARAFAEKLLAGVHEHRGEIDKVIQGVAQNWDIARMAVIDRNVLRLGCYEMLHEPDVPTKVAINEAIELAKRYSTEQSGAFVNGILDRIRKDRGLKV